VNPHLLSMTIDIMTILNDQNDIFRRPHRLFILYVEFIS
jgi:hypothetical protein